MTATTLPTTGHQGRHRRCRGIWLMTDDRPRRHRRARRGFGARGFGPGLGPGFGPGRRAGRGDIRAAILTLLTEQPMHGYQIIQEVAERSDGAWTPSPGSVYPTLQQLEDEGLVVPAESESGRRVFTLTDAGREAAAAAAGPAPWEETGADHELVDLRDLVHQVAAATRQVALAGTAAQVTAAQDILRTARKALYRLLAEDDQ